MLNSAIGLYYYLRVTVAMYFEPQTAESAGERRDWAILRVGVAVAAIFTVLIGVYPAIWTSIFRSGLGG
jgi:NADH-quinone oxidoreductase subunit N